MLVFINISGEADTPSAAIAEPIEILTEAVSDEGGGGGEASQKLYLKRVVIDERLLCRGISICKEIKERSKM